MSKEGRDEKGRFKEGNLFSVGLTNNGRPPIYENPKEMMEKIAEYLDWEDQWKNKSAKGEGKGIYTLSGLALYLGFATRKSLDDYADRSADFLYIINRFKLFMTHWNEQKLYWGGTFQGSFVWLKNHGNYSDDSTVNNNMTVTEVKVEQVKGTPPLEDKE